MNLNIQPCHIVDCVVVGGGMGGLACASLLQRRGIKTILIDAHSKLGGCASYFRRGETRFDAGATTLNGPQGARPLGQLFELLGQTPDLELVDPGLVVRTISGHRIRFDKSQKLFFKDLYEAFPEVDHRQLWSKIQRISDSAWDLVMSMDGVPLQDWKSIGELLRSPWYKGVPLLPSLIRTFGDFASSELTHFGGELEAFYDELLMISAQAKSHEVPLVFAALALTYPFEVGKVRGGMHDLVMFFEKIIGERDREILARRKVESIVPTESGWVVRTSKGDQIRSRYVVTNLPIWNMATLEMPRRMREYYWRLSDHAEKHQYWGALTWYFTVQGAQDLPSYTQLHVADSPSDVHGELFCSLSSPGSGQAPEGKRALTISTHTLCESWPERGSDIYRARKLKLIEWVKEQWLKAHPGAQIVDREDLGTPQSFIRYTHRYRGRVGGVPLDKDRNLAFAPGHRTPFQGLFQVGDTIFPGQGISAVSLGAIRVYNEIIKENFGAK